MASSAITEIVPAWEPVAGVAVVLFAIAGFTAWTDRRDIERYLSVGGWLSIVALWVVMLPYVALEAVSPLQTLGVLAAIPLSLWAGLVRWRGRDSLVVIGNAIAITGAIYVPISTIEVTRRWLIELVAHHTHELMGLLGHNPGIVADNYAGYASKFDFDGHTTYIVMACTGLGSIAVFAGAILAVDGRPTRKIAATVLIGATIYVLNLVRNVFVGLSTPHGWFDFEPFMSVSAVFGIEGFRNSYFISHTLLAQPISLLVVLGLTVVALRLVPGLFSIFDEVIYVFTGDDVDLRAEVGPSLGIDPGDGR